MDLNADGKLDILSGSYSRPSADMAGLFQVLWGTADGDYEQPVTLEGNDEEPLIIRFDEKEVTDQICTRPTAVDLNGDGKLDIVSGNFTGTFALFEGLGKGEFDPQPSWLTADGKPLSVPAHSDPFFIDWDADGDQDMLSGSAAGGIFLFLNVGNAKQARFQSRTELWKPLPELTQEEMRSQEQIIGTDHITEPRHGTRVFVADVNGDGKLDILIGDNDAVYFPAEGVSLVGAREALVEWKSKGDALNAAHAKNDPAVTTANLVEHLESQKEFTSLELAGFVWVMYQK